MEQNIEIKKYSHKRKWVYLSISVLLTGFIIFHACLSGDVSVKWSNFFVKVIYDIFSINGGGNTVAVDKVDVYLDPNYEYNSVDGYLEYEIPIGGKKYFESTIYPENATNKSVRYMVSDESIIDYYQEKSGVYVIGKSIGTTTLSVVSDENNSIKKSYTISITDKVAPISYEVSNVEVYNNSLFSLPLTYRGSSLLDSDYADYYDINKLDISLSNSKCDLSLLDQNYYEAKEIGEVTFTLKSASETKSFKVDIVSDASIEKHHINAIVGNNEIYECSKNYYKASLDNGFISEDVIWLVDNNEIASIDSLGTLNVNAVDKEEKIHITSISKLDTSLSFVKEITIKPAIIESFELIAPYSGINIADKPYRGNMGQIIKIWINDDTGTIRNKGVTVSCSNPEITSVSTKGDYVYISCIKEGTSMITVTSVANPNVSNFIDFEVTKKATNNNDVILGLYEFIRKSIGHFSLFLVDGIFTCLTLFYFLLDKGVSKKWIYIVAILGIGLVLAGISEIIQAFVPMRFATFIDVVTDFSGFALGAIIVNLTIFLIKRHHKKKLDKHLVENNN